MTFISYAQNFEDVMLWRALKDVECGFYIDVGANDPEVDSVTKAFYDRGWRGINIEPIEQWFDKLVEQRVRDINLLVAIGAHEGETVIYEFPDTGLSTLDDSIAERHESEGNYKKVKHTVPVLPLTGICKKYHIAPIHFLKIDVEGAEKSVLEGINFNIIKPWIVIVESTLPTTNIQDHEKWESILLNNKYEFVYFDGLNRFYVHKSVQKLKNYFQAPPNVFDDFSLSGTASQPFHRYITDNSKQVANKLENELQRAQAAEAQAQEQEQRAQAAEAQVQEQEQRAQTAEAQVQEQEQRAQTAEAQVQEQEQRAQWLESELKVRDTRIYELNNSSHHWWTVADNLNHELQTVYKSKSWRITWPLRQMMRGAKGTAKQLIRLIKAVLKPLLKVLIKKVLQRQRLHSTFKNWLQKFPGVYGHLRQFALHHGLIHSPANFAPRHEESAQRQEQNMSPENDGIEALESLSPSARQIYHDLKAAMEQHDKEQN